MEFTQRRRSLPAEEQEHLEALEGDEERRLQLLKDELSGMRPPPERFALVNEALVRRVK